jgi:hypothetical protein
MRCAGVSYPYYIQLLEAATRECRTPLTGNLVGTLRVY